jgi:Xaa-Pro aminopeptidase
LPKKEEPTIVWEMVPRRLHEPFGFEQSFSLQAHSLQPISETHDDRRLLPNTCFSVEPGIYLPEFGVRSEIDMLTSETQAWVTGKIQRELVRI